ncbi:MAG: hypothetical protein JEZ06_18455, partial [Anaerolineaceae bacterium]|nr:hypothetical protein [Anaerolineaceae bacterium]
MMKPSWKKILADFWESKARSILVMASIIIGAFAVGLNAVAYIILPEGMAATYAGSNPASIQLTTSPFDEELIAVIENMDGVEAAEGRFSVDVRSRPMGSDQQWLNMDLIAIQNFEDQQIELLSSLEGISNPEDRQIILLEDTLSRIDIEVGDTLEVKLSDNTIRELPVVGITKEYASGLERIVDNKVGYITFDTLEYLHQPLKYDYLSVVVDGDKNDMGHIHEVSERVIDQVEKSGSVVYYSATSRLLDHPFANYTGAIINILGVMGILTVALSTFLIINTMNSLISQQIRVLGVMKLVGARRAHIIKMYM